MFFWFIGIGILIFKYVFKDNTADLRFLITGLLILDFVDIIFLISPISKDKNFITHSLLFSVLTMFSIMVTTKRGTKLRKNLLLFSIGLYLHLFLDFMWLDQNNFLYPLPFETADNFDKTFQIIAAQEIIGAFYIVYKLKNKELLKKFIKTGVI
ncbi:MAG: metal-dependent hydrolase [Candidatus Actinomarina sp.]|tara:strand:+ start:81 stop:542 length:462 start_codon:yes stop_codon:yes gene_type:complete